MLPRIVPEIRVPRSGCYDEHVERNRRADPQSHETRCTIDGQDFIHYHANMRVPPKDSAQRPGDIAGRQRGSGHLVEQRLKQVMIGAVDEQHVGITQRLRGR